MCPNKGGSQAQPCLSGRTLEGGEGGGGNEERKVRGGNEEEKTEERGFKGWPKRKEVAEELIQLGQIACPILLTSLLFCSRSIISMLFLGHLGDTELAGGSLSIGFANITGYSLLRGLAMGMEPICGQAYGAKRWAVLSQTFQKTLIILVIATIPISLLWLNMETILLYLGQDEAITSVARVYINFSLPDLMAQAHLHPLRIFLRTQSLTTPITLSAIVAILLHLPINYLLVVYLRLGVKGVALASAWNTININLCLIIYLIMSNKALKPWSTGSAPIACFRGFKPLINLAFPSAVSVCLEWWWYELMLILCGLLTNPQANVAAMGILIQTTGFIYVFPSSLGLGLSTRVGHELGAGRPARAHRIAITGLVAAAGIGLLALVFTVVVRNQWGKMFTNDPQILVLTSISLPIVGFCELGNSPQTVGCGVLRGSARLKSAAFINFSSFYLVGLPVSAFAGFVLNFGFLGLWFGLVAAQASCACMMLCVISSTDWEIQAERARELTQPAQEEDDDFETSLLR